MGREAPVRVELGYDAKARRTKIASKSDLYHVKIILQIRTRSTCSITTLEYSEKEPALQCRRQDCTPDSSSLKPGPGATEGVLDKGVSDSRTIFIVRIVEASRYKTQDFGSCPDGTLLCVEDKLGDPDIVFPSL